jgi:hypothetical protein
MFKIANKGKLLGTVYGATEKEALAAAYKEFEVKTGGREEAHLRQAGLG